MRASPIARALSLATGWLADRRIPRPLRGAVYGAYCRLSGADPTEPELALDGYPSLGAFFVRRLLPGARPIDPDPRVLISPCDGTLQSVDTIREGSILQAKGREYPVRDLLAGAGHRSELEGGRAFTIYLSPSDYHRVHAPLGAELEEVRWVAGRRRSVAPRVLARRSRVLADNERAVLSLSSRGGPFWLVMVGALNVGRIRVVGVEPGESRPAGGSRLFERGAELSRFEMGSTVVLLFPPDRVAPLPGLEPGQARRLGQPIGRLLRP